MRNQKLLTVGAFALVACAASGATASPLADSTKQDAQPGRFDDSNQAMMIDSGLGSSGGGGQVAAQQQAKAHRDGDNIQAFSISPAGHLASENAAQHAAHDQVHFGTT